MYAGRSTGNVLHGVEVQAQDSRELTMACIILTGLTEQALLIAAASWCTV